MAFGFAPPAGAGYAGPLVREHGAMAPGQHPGGVTYVQAGAAGTFPGGPVPYQGYRPAACSWRSWILPVLVGLLLSACLAVLWVRRSRPGPSPEIINLALQAGGKDADDRGRRGTAAREQMARVFTGSHLDGESGPVVLSQSAQALRTAFQQQGFSHKTLYHGTNHLAVPLILDNGFLTGKGWTGRAIYTSSSLAHAQCYAAGDQGPILQLDVYYRPESEESFLTHIDHQSEVNDVYQVHDPLTVFPVKVIKCCPEEMACM